MTDELVEKLERVVFRLYRSMRRRPELQDLAPQDPVLLKRIRALPGVGVAELAELERLRGPTITSHIKRLVSMGMVRRVAHPTDRRRAGLHITARGQRAIERSTAVRHKDLAARLARLEPDELAILAQAADVLVKLAEEPGTEVRRAEAAGGVTEQDGSTHL